MTYDPVSQKIVLFGGFGGSRYRNDTWTFDGAIWQKQKPAIAPPARAAAGMAYDKALQKLVLYGGFDGHNYLGDTWMWDGATSTWSQMRPFKNPEPATLVMLFPDPRNGRVDNFGGWDGRTFQSTSWRWRDGSWRKLSPPQSPTARGGAICATDRVHKQTVLFGGLAQMPLGNTWTYDGHTWTQQSSNSQPSNRFYSNGVFDPRFNGVVAFGGNASGDTNDTWLWTNDDWLELRPAAVPPPRELFGIAFDELHQWTVIFGGLSGSTLLHDTWVLDKTN